MRKVKLVLFIIILVIGLVVRNFQPNLFQYFVYWWVLVLIVLIGLSLRLKSQFYLLGAFALFFISALFTVVGSKETGEMIMRVSLIGWVIGLTQSLVEYKKSKYL